MIITPHLLIGAVIGAKIRHFGWIIVLGIVSHLILDKIPHWDYGKRVEEIPRDKNFKKNLLIKIFGIGIDGLIGLLIIAPIIWQKDMMNLSYLPFILVGVIASLLLDFILGIAKLSCHKSKFSKSYVSFHHKFLHHLKHIRKPTPIGLSTQILVSVIAILILLF